MLVFAGLWGHCDKSGRFEWRPRQLKLDILPFLDFDMADTLALLHETGFIYQYHIDGKAYGQIESFEKHQRISGKEAQEPEKHPAPLSMICESLGKQQGSARDEQESQEGNGVQEGNGKNSAPDKPAKFDPRAALSALGVSDPVLSDWLTLRKQKRAPVTMTALDGISREAGKASISLHAALEIACKRGWQGFEASWLTNQPRGSPQANRADERKQVGDILTGRATNERSGSNERDITGECYVIP